MGAELRFVYTAILYIPCSDVPAYILKVNRKVKHVHVCLTMRRFDATGAASFHTRAHGILYSSPDTSPHTRVPPYHALQTINAAQPSRTDQLHAPRCVATTTSAAADNSRFLAVRGNSVVVGVRRHRRQQTLEWIHLLGTRLSLYLSVPLSPSQT